VAESDQRAFSELFARHKAKLYDYLFVVTKSEEIAKELLLDTFMKIWLGRELAPQIRHVDAFLQKVAYNKALNFLTTAARRKQLQQLVAYELSRNEQNNETENILAEKEYQRLLQQALQLLSPQKRLIFSLSREQGLTHDQIAEELQLSRQTVKNHITEALKSIREFLAAQKGEDGLLLLLIALVQG